MSAKIDVVYTGRIPAKFKYRDGSDKKIKTGETITVTIEDWNNMSSTGNFVLASNIAKANNVKWPPPPKAVKENEKKPKKEKLKSEKKENKGGK